MVAKKLTLRLDEDAIRRGKAYAKRCNTSLSKLIETHLLELDASDHEPIDVVPVPPEIEALSFRSSKRSNVSFEGFYDEYLQKLALK